MQLLWETLKGIKRRVTYILMVLQMPMETVAAELNLMLQV